MGGSRRTTILLLQLALAGASIAGAAPAPARVIRVAYPSTADVGDLPSLMAHDRR